ncbi:hypothetical protein [Gordonia sp. (in: high G+C Gram-positive bacteria)]|uniref:hypothetical protein n=1 Tax=Gordonia sp. (in: high G+C Gram-positive bacteria) TaxID=84139 RepID=UPI0016AF24BC|nr:hypothetical protein [Gordonia sp. (in: high G+C Gram-positive bacteria)]NLG47958.1 hypothetical protein [Gordonia sp. (in: high G+C Gram-positive bacteria)]
MTHTALLITTARRAAVVAATGAAALSFAALSVGGASAAPGANLDDKCLEFSADGNSGWSTAADSTIPWTGQRPSPGSKGEVVQAKFSVRNICDTPAKFQAYAGNWSVGGGGSAYLRADLGGTNGSNANLVGNPGILVAEKNIAKDTPMSVTLRLGIPADETAQNFEIKPNWAFALEEVAPGGGNGGGDDCNSGSLGGALGSLGCSTGSLGGGSSASKLIQVDSPTVISR